jgi:TRAP-type C4-dicarboxylate transport system permease small subunit
MRTGAVSAIGLVRVVRWAERAVRHLLALVALSLVALNVVGSMGRYTDLFTISWADEVQLFLLIWGVGLGAFVVSLRKAHLTMDVVFATLPTRMQRTLEGLIAIVSALLLGFVGVQSWRFVDLMAAIDQRSMAAALPMTVPHSAVLAGCAAMILALLVRAYLALRGVDANAALDARDAPRDQG